MDIQGPGAAVLTVSGNNASRIFYLYNGAALLDVTISGLTLTAVDVPDEDWAARSQASLKAVRVGNLIVAPPWDAPIVVAIRPSMGFGTGHHASTRGCLVLLERAGVGRGTRACDVGTGSGILAIAAAKLGAHDVWATDIDPAAVANVSASADHWEKVVRKLRTQSMPPPGVPRPDAASYDRVATFLETELDRAEAARPHLGKLPLHLADDRPNLGVHVVSIAWSAREPGQPGGQLTLLPIGTP